MDINLPIAGNPFHPESWEKAIKERCVLLKQTRILTWKDPQTFMRFKVRFDENGRLQMTGKRL